MNQIRMKCNQSKSGNKISSRLSFHLASRLYSLFASICSISVSWFEQVRNCWNSVIFLGDADSNMSSSSSSMATWLLGTTGVGVVVGAGVSVLMVMGTVVWARTVSISSS